MMMKMITLIFITNPKAKATQWLLVITLELWLL